MKCGGVEGVTLPSPRDPRHALEVSPAAGSSLVETPDITSTQHEMVSSMHSKRIYFQSFARASEWHKWWAKCICGVPSFPWRKNMKRPGIKISTAGGAVLAAILASGMSCAAQDRPPEPAQETAGPAPAQLRQRADGERHGLPLETYAGAPGTKFLVRLEDELGTKGTKENETFKVRTLEPHEAGRGIYLPSGAG